MAILSVSCARRAAADAVETAYGEVVSGLVRGGDARTLTIAVMAKKGEPLRTFPMTDLVRITFEPVLDRQRVQAQGSGKSLPPARHLPLIDNDHAGIGNSISGTIKLRAGYHRFALPYWHGTGRALLRLQYSYVAGATQHGLRIVPQSMLAQVDERGTETPSPGFDKEGYRLADVPSSTASNVAYKIFQMADGRRYARIGDLVAPSFVLREGNVDRVSASVLNDDINVAMLIRGYLKVPEDGEYAFLLSSDGGSQLYFGEPPGKLRSMSAQRSSMPWRVVLAGHGSVSGTIEKWADAKLAMTIRGSNGRVSLAIPTDRLLEVWSNAPLGKDDKLDRANLPAADDLVFARSAAGRIQRVPGRVGGIDGPSLRVRFGGEDRKIAMAKVVGVILARGSAARPEEQSFYQLLESSDKTRLPGRLVSLDGLSATFETAWGDRLTFDVDDLTSLTMQNGKSVALTQLSPVRVEQVPFFDRMVPYRVNESLSGGQILLQDGPHSLGICVHARTALAYSLAGRYERFRAKVGFQLPEGALGDATVRVLGDDKVLFERPSLRGDDPVVSIDLDVARINTLTLVVDFGRGQDVGDRVVWADPMLIRASPAPAAPGK